MMLKTNPKKMFQPLIFQSISWIFSILTLFLIFASIGYIISPDKIVITNSITSNFSNSRICACRIFADYFKFALPHVRYRVACECDVKFAGQFSNVLVQSHRFLHYFPSNSLRPRRSFLEVRNRENNARD